MTNRYHHLPPLDPTPLHALRRHGRLWRRFLIQAIVRETHYRTHVIATTIVGLMQLVLSLIPVLLLYSYTDEVNGWSRGDVIALGGIYQVSVAILWFGVETNMTRISPYIREGDLDMILIRPISALFYVTLRWVKPAEMFMIVSGLAVTVIGLSHGGTTPSPANVLQAILLVASGVILLTCAWSATVFISFWFTTVSGISTVFEDVMQAGKFPLSFYPSAVRLFLAFVFPVGFASTFPVEALANRGDWRAAIAGVVLSAVSLLALRWYWRIAVRSYSSASS